MWCWLPSLRKYREIWILYRHDKLSSHGREMKFGISDVSPVAPPASAPRRRFRSKSNRIAPDLLQQIKRAG